MNLEIQFSTIVQLIQQARGNAYKAVNSELINLYWQVGEYISKKVADASWGDKTVEQLAEFIQKNNPDLKGYNRRGSQDHALVGPLEIKELQYQRNSFLFLYILNTYN